MRAFSAKIGLTAPSVLAAFIISIPLSHAQTADGQTPAEENICSTWGFTGKVSGLCNAYCEAMDCDAGIRAVEAVGTSGIIRRVVGFLERNRRGQS